MNQKTYVLPKAALTEGLTAGESVGGERGSGKAQERGPSASKPGRMLPSAREMILTKGRVVCVNGCRPQVESVPLEFIGKTQEEPCVSYLRNIFNIHGKKTLHQSMITDHGLYSDFAGFLAGFKAMAVYPRAQATKAESYGLTPTLFEEGVYKGRLGHWRRAEFATDSLTLFYADIDNANPAYPQVTIDDIEDVLRALGVSYLLYTSFSHKPERHKVRIMCPVSRAMTYRETFIVFLLFQHLLEHQGDASIYDPSDYLYGPGPNAEIRSYKDGLALEVDAIIKAVMDLGPTALEPLDKYDRKSKEPARALTEEEIQKSLAQMKDTSVRGDISIDNPKVVNPAWLDDIRSCSNGGSHRQTLLSVLTKIWVKSDYSLTAGELASLQADLDALNGLYCHRKYGQSALRADIKSVLNFRGTNTTRWKPSEDFRRDKSRDRWMKYRR